MYDFRTRNLLWPPFVHIMWLFFVQHSIWNAYLKKILLKYWYITQRDRFQSKWYVHVQFIENILWKCCVFEPGTAKTYWWFVFAHKSVNEKEIFIYAFTSKNDMFWCSAYGARWSYLFAIQKSQTFSPNRITFCSMALTYILCLHTWCPFNIIVIVASLLLLLLYRHAFYVCT